MTHELEFKLSIGIAIDVSFEDRQLPIVGVFIPNFHLSCLRKRLLRADQHEATNDVIAECILQVVDEVIADLVEVDAIADCKIQDLIARS